MKIAVTAAGPGLDAPVDPHFASAPHIAIVDSEDLTFDVLDNPAASPGMGHGIVAARFVAVLGAGAVISGDFCPHSFAALRSIGVELYAGDAASTVGAAIALLGQQQLPAAQPAARHHHMAHAAPRRPVPVVSGD